MEEFTFDMPKREARTTELIKMLELTANACTPQYKLKLKKNGRIKVKITNISINVTVKLTVEVKSGIRKNETWHSNGTNYRVVDITETHATLINESINMAKFVLPSTFLYMGIQYYEGSEPLTQLPNV